MPEAKYQRAGQEGGRWVNVRPGGEEVAKWFTENVKVHDGMEVGDYLTGVTVIPTRAKENEIIGFAENGAPTIQERSNLYFTPYVKVETRIAYFWRLMDHHPDWLGVIEPVGGGVEGLPPGYFYRAIKGIDGKDATFVACSMRCRVYKRSTVKRTIRLESRDGVTVRIEEIEGETVIDAPPATKVVNVLGRYGPDENAMMKAETGAIGRALGFAGMLVAPGSGVATAEDMQDALATEGRATVPALDGESATLPEVAQAEDEDSLRERAKHIIEELQSDHPEVLAEFQRWARSRHFSSLNALVNPALKGVTRKLEGMLAEARRRSEQGAGAEDVALGGEEPQGEPEEPQPTADSRQPEAGREEPGEEATGDGS